MLVPRPTATVTACTLCLVPFQTSTDYARHKAECMITDPYIGHSITKLSDCRVKTVRKNCCPIVQLCDSTVGQGDYCPNPTAHTISS